MPTLGIIVASTREGRAGRAVADWFVAVAGSHGKFAATLIDLAEVGLPLVDEPEHPRLRHYRHEHTRAWSATVARFDAFVMVTPEYNYSSPPALVNALDYLVHEWGYKAVGFVSYGGVSGGTRSVQMTKLIVTALRMMPLPEAVNVPMFSQFMDKASGVFAPPAVQADAGGVMLDELLSWTEALAPLRARRTKAWPALPV